MSDYVIHFDGSCRPSNPGPEAAWGYTISKGGLFVSSDHGLCSGKTIYSSNYAEFVALHKALSVLESKLEIKDRLFIRGDSKLVINIMQRKWKAKSGIYYDAYQLAETALHNIRSRKIYVSIDWVPRTHNQIADKLSKA